MRQLTPEPFTANEAADGVAKRLTIARYAWLTTVAPSGIPTPTLVWFRFDGSSITVYSLPHADRVTHIFQHPQVSLHLESDGIGSNVVIVGGHAAVTAEGVDPRSDREFWAKYHVEAVSLNLEDGIASHSTRITVTPSTLWTTIPA